MAAALAEDEVTPPDEGELPQEIEPIDDFLAELSSSLATGDTEFALERLHPQVLEAYPDQCPGFLESISDPTFDATADSAPELADFTWELPDGRSFPIDDDTFEVSIQQTQQGQTGEAVSHFSIIETEWRWFTFCG